MKNKTVECYCCHKEYELKDITKIYAGKDEYRFVCKGCNNLKDIPIGIIGDK